MTDLGESRRAIIPGAHVGAAGIHELLLQHLGDLPILAVKQRDRWRAELGDLLKDRINAAIIKKVSRPRGLPRPLHLQVELEGADAVFVCEIGDFFDVLVGADDRREKKIDRRGFRRLIENRHRLREIWNIGGSLHFIGAAGDRQAYELQTPGRHTGSRGGPCLAFKIGGQVAMAAEVTLGIDHSRKKVFAAQVDDLRSASGKNASLPTAAIFPSATAMPPSMTPEGVTIRPFLKTISP